MPARHGDARGSGRAEREVSFTPRDAHPRAASAGSGLGLQHVPEGGSGEISFQKLLLPSATPASSP